MSFKAQPGLKGNRPSYTNFSHLGNRVKIVKLCPVNEKVQRVNVKTEQDWLRTVGITLYAAQR